jgi:hypothetical protein
MMGAHPLTEMRARRSRRALSTWRRYSASTTGAAMAAVGLEIGERSGRGRARDWAGQQRRSGDAKITGLGSPAPIHHVPAPHYQGKSVSYVSSGELFFLVK